MILLRMFLLVLFTTSLGVTTGAFELLLPTETSEKPVDQISHHDETSQLPAPVKVVESETEELEKHDDSLHCGTRIDEEFPGLQRTIRGSQFCCDRYSQRAGEESHFCLPPPAIHFT